MIPGTATRKFTVEEYYKLEEAGILKEDDRVELIEGEIVEMAPIGSRHFAAVNRLMRLLDRQIGDRGIVSVQNPLLLSERSMPQPDIVLLAPSSDDYRHRIPGPENTLLIVEIADSSLQYDRLTKAPLYARAGIAEVWLVDLVQNCIEVYRQPQAGEFSKHLRFDRGSEVSPQPFPDIKIRVEDIVD